MLTAMKSGTIDEVRISATARSRDWINTSYNNQVDATTGDRKFIKTLADETPVPEGEAPVPDPSVVVLFAAGLVALVVWFGRGKRKRGLDG